MFQPNTQPSRQPEELSEEKSKELSEKRPANRDSGSTSTVEFFARVRRAESTVEVPISADLFKSDATMLVRYAEWKEHEGDDGMDVTFKQFSKIFGFAKKV
jgi:hypothetical protein